LHDEKYTLFKASRQNNVLLFLRRFCSKDEEIRVGNIGILSILNDEVFGGKDLKIDFKKNLL